MSSYYRVVSLVLGLLLLATALPAAGSPAAGSPAAGSPAADSPQFRGPARDGTYPAEGLLQSWPEDGPPQLWQATGLGEGFSSVAVAGGRLYTTGMSAGEGSVVAFDLQGKEVWRRGYGKLHSGEGYPGSRTTPTVDGDTLYLLSSMGRALALDPATGEVRWQVDLVDAFGARNINWGITESPLVVGDRVIFTAGGSGATLVALDKKSGEKVWATAGPDEPSAYCSPRLLDNGKHRQIVTMTKRHVIGVDAASGELLWDRVHPGNWDIHAVSPLFLGSVIYVSDGYGKGTNALELAADGRGVTRKWEQKKLDVHHGGMVLVDGHLYGAADNGTWYALDAASGEIRGTLPRAGKGAVVYADGRLYGYVEKGQVLLVDPDPASLRVVSKLKISAGAGHHWSHPVIAGGVLYVRHGDVLMAFDVRDGG